MIDSKFRSGYQRWLVAPVVALLKNAPLSPTTITAFACVAGTLVPLLLYFHKPYSAVGALLFSGYCDTLDGSLARQRQCCSPIGTVCDILSDRWVEFCVLLGLYSVNTHARALTTICMLGAVLLCVTSFLVVSIFSENSSEKSFHYSPGLMERSEAFFFFIALILFPSLYSLLSWLFTALLLATALTRTVQFARQARPRHTKSAAENEPSIRP